MVEENQIKPEIKEKRFDKWIKILSIILGIVIILVIVLMGLAEIISWFWTIMSIIITILVIVVVFLFFYFFGKNKSDIIKSFNNHIKAITLFEARKLAKEMTLDPEYADYSDDGQGEEIRKLGDEGQEKTPIYIRKAKGEFENQTYVAIINMINPDERTFLISPSEEKVEEAANLLAKVPASSVEEELTKKNPFTGAEETLKRKTTSHREKQIADELNKLAEKDI